MNQQISQLHIHSAYDVRDNQSRHLDKERWAYATHTHTFFLMYSHRKKIALKIIAPTSTLEEVHTEQE